MALWDAVKKGAQKMAEGAGKVTDEIQRREELKRNKTKALRRLTLRQLQYMAKNYGIKVTSHEFVFDDEQVPKLTIDDYIISIRSNLSYEEIINYLKKRKVNVSDLISESNQNNKAIVSNVSQNNRPQTEISTELSSDEEILYSVLCTISQEFDNSLKVIDEYEFESHLSSLLNFTYGKNGWNIHRQVECGQFNDKIDIVLENHINTVALELKIGNSKTHIRNSLGQLHTYAKHYPNISLVVLDIGKINSEFYNQFEQDLNSFGVSLLVLEGNLRKKRNKTKTATVKFS
ncbi:hypothetical protein [Methanolobus vulcani]|uniref:Uncharacterized protein n=1 Tax=Methanolobus vulcani TaxID=38026 RepID=A0A7Z8P3D4_9EURY|nr:hypothetical protein [Methanolobus vulcani]TQD27923.1 hypothetical protein FKV42_02355 [Methanolobus vulcani]